MSFEWSIAADTLLAEYWEQGESGSFIAAAFGRKYHHEFTRNMILGRLNRIGLVRNNPAHNRVVVTAWHTGTRPTPAGKKTPIARPRNKVRTMPKQIEDLPGPVVAIALPPASSQCTYLLGEPRHREFCKNLAVVNRVSVSGRKAWCQKHLEKVYRPEMLAKKTA